VNKAEQIVGSLLEDEPINPKDEVEGMKERDPMFGLPTIADVDEFTQAYLEAAFFTDEERLKEEATEKGLDPEQHDFDWSPEALTKAQEDCAKFQKENQELLDQAGDVQQNGHDFWYTRNGHGVGFWDRGYDDAVADPLTEACKAFHEAYTYLGDDGLIYLQ
jgi:hypothetical protein